MLATTPALSAGFERVTVSDPDGQPLEAGIWYPSEAPTSSQPIGLGEHQARIASALPGNLPDRSGIHASPPFAMRGPFAQAAIQALVLAADNGGPTKLARIGIMRALHAGKPRSSTASRSKPAKNPRYFHDHFLFQGALREVRLCLDQGNCHDYVHGRVETPDAH